MKLTHNQIAKLVEQLKASQDAQAFTTLYEATYQSLYYLALSIMKNEDDAQDAVQESYIKILGSIQSLDNGSLFIAWANRITYHMCLRMIDKAKDIPMEDEKFDAISEKFDDQDPLTIAMTNSRNKELVQLLQQLDPLLRTTIVLKYYQDMKISEIALVMDCPEGTVKSRLNTAKKQLKSLSMKEKRYNMMLGAFGFFTLRQALVQSARGVSLSPEISRNILQNVLKSSNMSADVSFTPSPSAAPSPSMAFSAALPAGIAAAAGGVAAGIALTATPLPPQIVDISVSNQYTAAPSVINITLKEDTPLKEITAVSSEDHQVCYGIRLDGTTYQIPVPSNGTWMITAVDSSQRHSEAAVQITNIDDESPCVLSWSNTDSSVTLQLDDSQSGIDYSSITGIFPDGSQLSPLSVDKTAQTVTFSVPEEDFVLFFKDMAGNASENPIQILIP